MSIGMTPFNRWLDAITKAGSRYNYRSAFRSCALFTGMAPSALIEEAIEYSKEDPRQKRHFVLRRLIQHSVFVHVIRELLELIEFCEKHQSQNKKKGKVSFVSSFYV